jgi:hypothetical protein
MTWSLFAKGSPSVLPGSDVTRFAEGRNSVEDRFLTNEWTALCERLRRTAGHFGNGSEQAFAEEVRRFTSQPAPQHYPALLERTREAAELAQRWRQQKSGGDRRTREGNRQA